MGMTDDQLEKFVKLIGLGKFKPDNSNYERWAYQRGWNAALEYVEEKMDSVLRAPEPVGEVQEESLGNVEEG